MRNILIRLGCALTIALGCTYVATADYTATQGAGTNFSSIVIGGVHHVAMVLCDATLGETRCQTIATAGGNNFSLVQVGDSGGNIMNGYTAGTAAAPSSQIVSTISPSQYPANTIPAVPVTSSSGNVAAASAVATLAAAASKSTFITGFQATGSGATLGSCVNITVTGVIGGTMTYTFCAAAGVLVSDSPLIVSFSPPLQSSAVNTAIVVTMPSLGTGNTNAAVNAQGYQL